MCAVCIRVCDVCIRVLMCVYTHTHTCVCMCVLCVCVCPGEHLDFTQAQMVGWIKKYFLGEMQKGEQERKEEYF